MFGLIAILAVLFILSVSKREEIESKTDLESALDNCILIDPEQKAKEIADFVHSQLMIHGCEYPWQELYNEILKDLTYE